MARIAEPHELPYGDATVVQHWDPIKCRYVVTVKRADDRIGVHREFWDQSHSAHRIDDHTLVLDTAGEYRYRLVEDDGGNVLIFERIHDDEPECGHDRAKRDDVECPECGADLTALDHDAA